MAPPGRHLLLVLLLSVTCSTVVCGFGGGGVGEEEAEDVSLFWSTRGFDVGVAVCSVGCCL